ncbi:hypothetical protein VTK56DRAFT_6224 [Thermocarpiscus australiensis]
MPTVRWAIVLLWHLAVWSRRAITRLRRHLVLGAQAYVLDVYGKLVGPALLWYTRRSYSAIIPVIDRGIQWLERAAQAMEQDAVMARRWWQLFEERLQMRAEEERRWGEETV